MTGYNDILIEARQIAIGRMVDKAEAMGTNFMIGLRKRNVKKKNIKTIRNIIFAVAKISLYLQYREIFDYVKNKKLI